MAPKLLKGLDASPEKVSAFRARDVRVLLQGTNTDPKVSKCLEALAESNHDNQKQIMAMANMLNQMADVVAGFAVIAENMKKVIEIPEDMKGLV